MASPILNDLAAQISTNASTLSDFYTATEVEQPSFSCHGPATFPAGASNEVLEARNSLIWAAKQLQMLALGPTESLQWMALSGALDTASLRWIHHFNIPAAVPLDGSTISFSALASTTGLHQSTLTRILRHAITNNIFLEPSPGEVGHSALSRLLADANSNPIRGVVGHQTEVVFPAVAHMVDAHDRYGTADDCVTHTPFNEAFGTEMRALDWIASDAVRAARFAESMKGGARSGQFGVEHTVDGFDWRGLGRGVVVDVGGSTGQVSAAICAAAPDLTCIVQDLPSMITKGQSEIAADMQTRISFTAHDFFEPQPVDAPAVFLLRLILHDWPDQDACRILRRLAKKMGPETRILINDSVMPDPRSVDGMTEKRIRNLDLMMMAMFNGQERSREAWAALVKMADSELYIASIFRPEGSALSMIEVGKSFT